MTVPGIRAVQSRAAADKNIGGIKRSGSIKSDSKRAEYIRHCSAGAVIWYYIRPQTNILKRKVNAQ